MPDDRSKPPAVDLSKVHACLSHPKGDESYAAIVTLKKWPNGQTLRVLFLDGDPNVQDKVIAYAQTWSQFANIFVEKSTDPDAEIRVSFLQPGSWSAIGTDALNAEWFPADGPTMNYGWLTPSSSEEEYRRVVTHEFGHALGLIHEHQNPAAGINWNKPAVYSYYEGPPNNWTPAQVDVNLFQTYDKDQTQYTQTDPQSIMMYPIDPGLTTDGLVVGWNSDLSPTDQAFIASQYPKS